MLDFSRTDFSFKPYPLGLLTDIFSPGDFSEMRAYWPDPAGGKVFTKAVNKSSISHRVNSDLFERITRTVPIWRELRAQIESEEFLQSVFAMLESAGVDIGIKNYRAVRYGSWLNRVRRPFARLFKRNYLCARMEFSAMPADGGHITPHTDMPSKIMTIVINFDGAGDGFEGGTSVVEPKDERKIHNPSNTYLEFDAVTEVRRVNFKRNCGLFFIRTDNSWHCVFPISGLPGTYRRSININIDRIR